jgi:hypothetical protein
MKCMDIYSSRAQAAEELEAVIFVHPWDMPKDGRFAPYWMPWLVGMPAETCAAIVCMILGGVLERFPKLKVCFAHGGVCVCVRVLCCVVCVAQCAPIVSHLLRSVALLPCHSEHHLPSPLTRQAARSPLRSAALSTASRPARTSAK